MKLIKLAVKAVKAYNNTKSTVSPATQEMLMYNEVLAALMVTTLVGDVVNKKGVKKIVYNQLFLNGLAVVNYYSAPDAGDEFLNAGLNTIVKM